MYCFYGVAIRLFVDYPSHKIRTKKICVFLNPRHTLELYILLLPHTPELSSKLNLRLSMCGEVFPRHHRTMETAWREQHNLGNKSGHISKSSQDVLLCIIDFFLCFSCFFFMFIVVSVSHFLKHLSLFCYFQFSRSTSTLAN